LVDVNSATFLISENIKSPMGANLTAFSSNKEADKALDQHGGGLFNWDNIQQIIK
jgi:copper chaperone NosL